MSTKVDKTLRGHTPHQHGVKGAYVGGEWVDIEDCAEKFNIKDGSNCIGNGNCKACPRSRSRVPAVKADGTYDVAIIGAGCIGAAIARELAKYNLSTVVIEAADDVTQGATKGNSGIVHAGFDDTPGTNRAKFCWPGNQMFEGLDRDLHFGYQKNGSLVLATTPEEVKILHELKKKGEKNGVQRLRVINRDEVLKLEPYVSENVIGALHSPDAGNLIPYEYAIALMENAVDNGVELLLRREVTAIERIGGDGSDISSSSKSKKGNDDELFIISMNHWEPKVFADIIYKQPPAKSIIVIMLILAYVLYRIFFDFEVIMEIEFVKKMFIKVGFPEREFCYALCTSACFVAAAVMQILLAFTLPPKSKHSYLEGIKRAGHPVGGTAGRSVTVDEMAVGGSGSAGGTDGVIVSRESLRCKYIVNAAGCASDKVSAMIGDTSFKIKPRIGDYILLHRDQGHLTTHTLFPCPDPILGKGVLVQTTLWGNLILGPTARDMHTEEASKMSHEEIQAYILGKCNKLVPHFDPSKTIHAFSGSRAKSTRGDWIIEPSEKDSSFIHAAGIDSPGLAGSPAIAIEIVRLLANAGLALVKNTTFNPKRAPIISVKNDWKGLKLNNPPTMEATEDPKSNVICKCEKVTEAEVIEACHRSLPIDSTQAIRKRTRAGMGHCQGNEENYNCECRVASIIARETKMPVEAIGRRPWPATTTLPRRWLSETDKQKLVEIQVNAK